MKLFETKILKYLILTLYALIIVCAGFATILEKYHGSTFVSDKIYGASWFVGLWIILVAAALVYIWKVRLHRRPAVMMLHLSFVVILLGAMTTHITAERGTVHLRTNTSVSTFQLADSTISTLPFELSLKEFRIIDYPGTQAAMDYQSIVSVKKGDDIQSMSISMNSVGEYDGYRFFQSAYDSDGEGTILGVSYDPYGIAITYIGYLLLLISIIWTLYAQREKLKSIYQEATKPLLCLLLLMCSISIKAQQVPHEVSPEIAHKLGSVVVLYNDRLCPLNTAAIDFVTKLTGKSSWHGYSADEIFVGWMIYYTEWEDQKIIKVKNAEVQRMLGINGKWASMKDFYTPQQEYKLEARLKDNTYSNATKRAIRETDEKVRTISMFYNSEMLHIFPYKTASSVLTHGTSAIQWYTPGSTELPKNIPDAEFQFIKHAMDYLVQNILVNDVNKASVIIAKIKLYQREKAAEIIPSPLAIKAEIFYNSLQYARWIVFLILTIALLQCCIYLFGSNHLSQHLWWKIGERLFMSLFVIYLTTLLILRWWISGHLPMSNGFETMLFMSWVTMVFTLCVMKRIHIMKAFGPFLAALCLLVSMIASGTPQITQLMPVLQSPLLSVHVMVIMASYALFAIMSLLAIQSLTLLRKGEKNDNEVRRQTALSRLILYPAVFLLAIGIFIGAVWANVSWGTYWSWDPKEVWALITLMIYAIPLHCASFPAFSKPKFYNLYILLAFLAVLMTYFGVNYFLPGMHSYA